MSSNCRRFSKVNFNIALINLEINFMSKAENFHFILENEKLKSNCWHKLHPFAVKLKNKRYPLTQ